MTARGTASLGFVHACEQNHTHLCLIGGGAVTQLASGKAVTCPLDPVFVFNFVFGVRRQLDLAGAAAAFRAAGRPYLHVMASPSSRVDLGEQLAAAGLRVVERQAFRRATGTGAGAPGLVLVGADAVEELLALWWAAWAAEVKREAPTTASGNRGQPSGRPVVADQRAGTRAEIFRLRLQDPRTRAFRSADGTGMFLLFDAGPTTQLIHLGVARAAQGRGTGRRMLALAPGLVPAGRPLWLFTKLGGAGDRAAAAAGWALTHTAENWMLDL
jgi:hypothetical protein